MLAKLLASRVLARLAVAGLAVGLIVIAGLATWGSVRAEQSAEQLRANDEITAAWSQVFESVNLLDEAALDYLRADDEVGRLPLSSALALGEPRLDLLRSRRNTAEAPYVQNVLASHRAFTQSLEQMIEAGRAGDRERVDALAEQASLAAASLRKQVTANMSRKRIESTQYLMQSVEFNRRLRTASALTFAFDVLILGAFSIMLLKYQRRVERQAAKSENDALHDSLTGLANRLLLSDRVTLAIRSAGRSKQPVALLLIDLDRFKQVNDTLGHHSGDVLLQEVSRRLSAAVRPGDSVARLGGDEFAIVLPSVADAHVAAEVARRVLSAVGQPVRIDDVDVDVSASIGIALYPDDSENGQQLLQHADVAMYSAKHAQTGVALYDADLDENTLSRLALVRDLREAIADGALILHYQPKVVPATGSVHGVEALVRWPHPRLGLLGPDAFIPLAQQSGLIEALTSHVLATALEQCSIWGSAGLHLPVAVNVSARSVVNSDFPDEVAQALQTRGIAAEMLTIELTESSVIEDPVRALEVLRRLRALGVRLSIDDFGTGYSSLTYLRSMPVHELKIDRSFIARLLTEHSDAVVVRHIIELSASLRLDTVAEGVEDAETLHSLAAMGCDLAQGFYISRPMPADEVADWIRTRSAAAGNRTV